jgi:outer membrane protein OmpA-like peptidoglycan-associated protein
MDTTSRLSAQDITVSLVLVGALLLGVGLPANTGAAAADDRFISQDEFSALFEPDPAETLIKRGLAKVPRPGLDPKKREATTYVLFETGTILLNSPESFQQLDAAGRAFKKALEVGKADKWVIEIAGHTDNVGSPEINLKLSQERAESVRQYLLQTYKLPPQVLIAKGYGQTQPIASNDTPDGREKNRRVVFKVTKQTPPATP